MDERLIPYQHMYQWQWQGIVILEPFTIITNLLITAACFGAWARLRRLPLSPAQKLANIFFLLMAIATLLGGVLGHGFLYLTGQAGKLPGWYVSMVAVAAFERSAIAQGRQLMPPRVGQFFSALNYIEIIALMILCTVTLNFRFVEFHAAYGLLVVVFGFTAYVYYRTRAPYCRSIFYATFLGFLAALVHQLKPVITPWFNYNDASHLFMAAAVGYYYLGVRHMHQLKENDLARTALAH